MERLWNKLSSLIREKEKRKYWVSLISALAGLVVFITTYALILPAITLEEEVAEEMAGMDLEDEIFSDDAAIWEEWTIADDLGGEILPDDTGMLFDVADETGDEGHTDLPDGLESVFWDETEPMTEAEDWLDWEAEWNVLEEPEELPEPETEVSVLADWQELETEGREQPDLPDGFEAWPTAEHAEEPLLTQLFTEAESEDEAAVREAESEDEAAVREAASEEKEEAGEFPGQIILLPGREEETGREAPDDVTDETDETEEQEKAEGAAEEETEAKATAAEEETEAKETAEEAIEEETEEETESEPETETDALVYREVDVAGADYTLEITYDPSRANIPRTAEFTAVSLDETADVSQAELCRELRTQAIDSAAEEEEERTSDNLMVRGMFDLTITGEDEQALQPEAELSIRVAFEEEADASREFYAVGFQPEEGEMAAPVGAAAYDAQVLPTISGEGTAQFCAETASVYVIVGTVIEKTVLASDGKNYKVTVTYGAETGIPEGAELSVEEILPAGQDESRNSGVSSAYDEYVSKTENALGMEEGSAGYIRLFDIKIVDQKDRVKYQPAAGTAVDVQIELADAQSDALNVVHFADGEEAGTVVDVRAGSRGEGSSVEFQAEGFSVYSVVDVSEPEGQDEVTVTSLSDLVGHGFSISSDWNNSGTIRYMTTNYNGDKSFGSTKSKETGTIFYFDKDTSDGASENDFYIYYLNESNDKIYFTGSGSGSEWKPGLSETGNPFKVYYVDTNTIRIKMPAGWTYTLGNYGDPFTWAAANDADTHERFKLQLVSFVETVNDPYSLNGKAYGIVFNHDSVNALALISDEAGVSSSEVLIRPDVLKHQGTLLVSPDSDISKWKFTCLEGDIYTIQDENGKYLSISSSGAALKESADESCYIKVTAGSGTYAGKIRLSSGGYALSTEYRWNNNTGYTFIGFKVSQTETAETWFHLADDSVLGDDDFYSYSAEKISASDEILSATQKDESGEIRKDERGNPVYKSEKAKVIVYTRVWNDITKNYEYYAVDHDGTLVRVYESGDNINWVGSSINTMLWEFTEYTYDNGTPNYYYDLKNTVYNNYLAPQLMSNQIISDETIGINLNGRRYGQDYTSIIAWDDAAYSFSGLKVEDGKIVPCALSEADDFYFAYIQEEDEDEHGNLSTVATVDNNAYGITIKMQNYPYQNYYISGNSNSVFAAPSGGYRSQMQADVLGYDNTASPNGTGEGLLSTDLKENGYPDTTYLNNKGAGNKSLEQLYSSATPVNHLFLQSTYNETGYFEYDSTQNFAQLNENTGNFTVYEQLATGEINQNPSAFHAHGMFLPYNDITKASYSDVLYNLTDMSAYELPDSDPRKGESLYKFDGSYPGANGTPKEGAADYFFGMELEASFTQTPNGLDAWGHDIIFEFSGDDDFWLYVDGELIADLGGVRAGSGAGGGAQSAKINFSTGEVIVNNKSTTLYDLFKRHYDARVQDGEMTQTDANAKLEAVFTTNAAGNKVFTDYSSHTMKIFYMERGAGASNLHMKFNLAAVKPGTVELTKKLSGSDSESNSLIEFPYQIYYSEKSDGGRDYKLLTPSDGAVTYKNSITNVTYKNPLRIDGVDYKSVYMLKPGETAVINFPDDIIDYYIVECGVNTAAYDRVSANGTQLSGRNDTQPQGSEQSAGAASGARQNFSTTVAAAADRPQVEYDNHVAEGAMRTLSISKKLYDTNGETVLSYDADDETRKDETLFDFRLYLGNEYSDELSGANLYSYFVKNAKGEYCRWDRTVKKFAAIRNTDDQPITEYRVLSTYLATLTQAEQETILFKTSMNGAISRIPAGYSVEVRDLVIGTKWRVEERDNEIPKGYTRRDSDGYNRMDADHEESKSTPISDTIEAGESPEVEIRNQKGWGLTVQKIWTDKDFMEIHDPIYFAIYYRDDAASDGLGAMANVQEDSTRTDADHSTISIPAKSSLRQLKNGETELYYFFDDLKDQNNISHAFSDYVVREVVVTPHDGKEIEVDGDGYVMNYDEVTVTPAENAKKISVGGKPIGGIYHSASDEDSTYTVSYHVGDSTGQNANIRTDTVTNARPGIELYKTDWAGNNLSGAVFTLKDGNGKDVAGTSYTSDSSGLITTAYLSAGTYTLTETTAPKGYVGLTESLTIQINDDGSMSFEFGDNTISLKDGKSEGISLYFSVEKTAASGMDATVKIRNSRNELQAVKVDASTNEKLPGAHFALYRQVKGADGNLRKDLSPIQGCENLITDENGVIPKVTMDLAAGTYYLTETQAAEGYAGLNADICFTIGTDGTVRISSTGHSEWLTSQTNTTSGTTTYILTIPNGNVKDFTFHKVWYPMTGDTKQKWQKDITVTLYKKGSKGGEKVATYSIGMKDGKIVAAALSDEDAPAIEVHESGEINFDYSFTIKNLPFGDTYYLVETDLDNILIKYGAVVNHEVEVTQGAQNATEDEPYIINRDTGGYELPSTGGSGTWAYTILGSILVCFAGALLVRRRQITI